MVIFKITVCKHAKCRWIAGGKISKNLLEVAIEGQIFLIQEHKTQTLNELSRKFNSASRF